MRQPRAVGRRIPGSAAVLLAVSGLGCGVGAYEGELPRAADLSITVPAIGASSPESGALHALLVTTVDALDRRVDPLASDLEQVIGAIEGHQPDGRDGAARVFGPFSDPQDRDVEWTVTVDVLRRTTRWTLAAGDALGEPTVVADGSSTDGADGRTVAWTLWPARHAAAIGDVSLQPDIEPDATLELEVVVASGEGRTLAMTSSTEPSSDDPLGPVLEDGVRGWSDASGGRLMLRSAVPLATDVLTDPRPGLPWVEAAWDALGTGEIAAVVPHGDGSVVVRECLDPAGRTVFRSVDPASAAAPGQTFGEDQLCPGVAVLPQPP